MRSRFIVNMELTIDHAEVPVGLISDLAFVGYSSGLLEGDAHLRVRHLYFSGSGIEK
jgi:hypothetical protein